METMKYFLLLAGYLLVFACGSGGPEPSSVAEDSGASDPQALPNFTVVDFVAPSIVEEKGSHFRYEISIQNTGVGPGQPDLVWELSSTMPDFSTGYRFNKSSLTRIDNNKSTSLMPGEKGVYAVSKSLLPLGVKGDHYVKIWVNPDKGENFDTSENRVMSERETEESNYSDNFSEVAVINAPNGGANECTEIPDEENHHLVEDNLEENDSLGAAFPISLDTKYEATLCLDHKDVYKINLVAGVKYQIEVGSPLIISSARSTWVLINPDQSFFMNPSFTNKEGVKAFMATQTGEHWLAFYDSHPITRFLDDSYSFSISRLP